MNVVIKVENLSKQYRLGLVGTGTLSHDLNRWWARVRGKDDPALQIGKINQLDTVEGEYIWALKDINFEVKQGEVLGIIGKNGAGKSTLLKILSRVTGPTTGSIKTKGRIASLLEVGTGFHPELTGRENIFLNGAILGMTKSEIKSKLDEIIDFSGVVKYIDTPVKRYSSGMYVRLAFAVAAHLEPEILVVDEVLAVGDVGFQKKCLGKMKDVAGEGRTVLFVSHNMEAIMRLCPNTLLLENGLIQYLGSVKKAISLYLQSDLGMTSMRKWGDINKAPGNDIVRLLEVKVHTQNGKVLENFDITMPVQITMIYEVLKDDYVFTHICTLYNEQGINILNSHDVVSELRKMPRKKGCYVSTMTIPGNFLSEGTVTAGVGIVSQNPYLLYFHEKDTVAFNIVDDMSGLSARGDYLGGFPGIIRPILTWEAKKKHFK